MSRQYFDRGFSISGTPWTLVSPQGDHRFVCQQGDRSGTLCVTSRPLLIGDLVHPEGYPDQLHLITDKTFKKVFEVYDLAPITGCATVHRILDPENPEEVLIYSDVPLHQEQSATSSCTFQASDRYELQALDTLTIDGTQYHIDSVLDTDSLLEILATAIAA